MSRCMNRRGFLKHTGLAGVAAAIGAGAGAEKAAKDPLKPLPTIKFAAMDVSRFILGSNPFWGYSHKSRELDEEMKQYHTDEKIVEILDEAARCGLTTVVSPPDQRWCDLYEKYRAGGGKLRIWISQCHASPEKMEEEIDRSLKYRADAAFIQGARTESMFGQGKFDSLRAWLDRIKNAGIPGGFAAHWPEIHPELEKRKFPADFYFQCCYNASKGEAYRAEERVKANETIRAIEKPVVAYKILGAGRLAAADGFEQAFNVIRRKDGVCVGIWAKAAIDQIRENATLTEMLSAKQPKA